MKYRVETYNTDLYSHKNCFKLLVYIIDSCNYNCEYCYNDFPRTNIKLDLDKLYNFIKTVLIDIYKKDYIWLELIGGEPSLHPDLMNFCKKISKLDNIYTTIYTNFSKDVNFYANLLEIDSRISLILSWHSANKTFKEKISLLPRQYIQNNITVSVIYEHKNIDKALDVFDYVSSKFNDIKALSFPLIENNKRYCTLNYSNEDMLEYNKRLPHIKDNVHIKIVFNDKSSEIVNEHYFIVNDENKIFTRWLCNAGTDFCFIYFNGDICPCDGYKSKIKLGNLYSDNISKVVLNKKIFCEVKYCPCVFDVRKKNFFTK